MINLINLRKLDIYIINNLKNKIKMLNNKIDLMNKTEKQYHHYINLITYYN